MFLFNLNLHYRGVSREWPGEAWVTTVIWLATSGATSFDWLSAESEVDLFELFDKYRCYLILSLRGSKITLWILHNF